ncbi:MAG: putative glycoside hydrolase, partial [Sedimentisphaerales bacterium]|nr:putative glycoside hydrolase [Sedimentisphaerales bacterium]
MRKAIFLFISFLAVITVVVMLLPRQFNLKPDAAGQAQVSDVLPTIADQIEATSTATSSPENMAISNPNYPDISFQPQLQNPPSIVKAIYLTGWSAGSAKKVDETIAMIKRTELNAVVIDVKDYSGFVSYGMDIPMIKEDGAMKDLRMRAPNAVIKKFHDAGIYVIARVTVFQDPILAKYKPEWALQSSATGKLWLDNLGLAWMDPAGKGTWDYVISIAKDAAARGFDEVNFDY